LVQEGFLLGHEPCGGLRSSLELVIGSIGFWQDPGFIKLPCVALIFPFCLNSCNTSLPNLDWFESALFLFDPYAIQVRILGLNSTWIICSPIAETESI
jgi:hypothetical protein